MEEELGVEIFERLASGVRLSAAGEVYLHHIRMQLSDFERVKSQISDLKGCAVGMFRSPVARRYCRHFYPSK